MARAVLAGATRRDWYPTINVGPDEHRYADIAPLCHIGTAAHEPERPGLGQPRTPGRGHPRGRFVYANSFDDIEEQLRLCREHTSGVSIAVYEPGFLRVVMAYHRAGLLPAGAFGEAVPDRGPWAHRHSVRATDDARRPLGLPRAARRHWAALGRVHRRRGPRRIRGHRAGARGWRPSPHGSRVLPRGPHTDERAAGGRGSERRPRRWSRRRVVR